MKSITIPIPDDVSIAGWLLRALHRWSDAPKAGECVDVYVHPVLAAEVKEALANWTQASVGVIENGSFSPCLVRVEVKEPCSSP